MNAVKLFLLAGLAASGPAWAAPKADPLAARAATITITRDHWGIAHIRGRSDADAIFGMAYAQAEDDFNRVETNYLTSLGRLSEAEGEAALWKDLRQRLWIDEAQLRAQYSASPAWLRKLMTGWADGLNYYLATHPSVRPRVLTHFEPWMALSFSEGSIGGDIEYVDLAALRALYDRAQPKAAAIKRLWRAAGLERNRHRPIAQLERQSTSADQPAHQFLLPRRRPGEERRGTQRLWRGDLGAVVRLPGVQLARRLDAHLERPR